MSSPSPCRATSGDRVQPGAFRCAMTPILGFRIDFIVSSVGTVTGVAPQPGIWAEATLDTIAPARFGIIGGPSERWIGPSYESPRD